MRWLMPSIFFLLHATTVFFITVSSSGFAQLYMPTSNDELRDAILDSNINNENDIIDLGTLTRSYVSPYAGATALPTIAFDNGKSVTIQNGIIERDLLSPNFFRLIFVDNGANLKLIGVTLKYNFFLCAMQNFQLYACNTSKIFTKLRNKRRFTKNVLDWHKIQIKPQS